MNHGEISQTIEHVRALRCRAVRIAATLPTPEEPFFDDSEMLELEKRIAVIVSEGFGVRTVAKECWRPFWSAAYEDWGVRETGAAGFWAYVQARLTDTERILLELERLHRTSTS